MTSLEITDPLRKSFSEINLSSKDLSAGFGSTFAAVPGSSSSFDAATRPSSAAVYTSLKASVMNSSDHNDYDLDIDLRPVYATSRSSQKSLDEAPCATSDTLVASPGINPKHLKNTTIIGSEHEEAPEDSKSLTNKIPTAPAAVAKTLLSSEDVASSVITTPSLSSFGTYPLYIGDLHPDVTETLLYTVFGVCGPISSVRICRDAATQASLGYAYVNLQTKDAADKALDELNYTKILGRECRIMPAVNRSENRSMPPGSNIYVYNLHPSIESKTLNDRFSRYGKIISCKVVRNAHTGVSMCRGYVQYSCKKDADEAIAGENGENFEGSTMRVDGFVSREERLTTMAAKKAPAGLLTVSGISPSCSESDLKMVFGMFGPIHSVYFTLNGGNRNGFGLGRGNAAGFSSGTGSGWGYVNYYDSVSARMAKSILNDVIWRGLKLRVNERDPRNQAGEYGHFRQQQQQQQQQQPQQQFPIVFRTFDKSIIMENIEEMLKDTVPLIDIPPGAVKVYSRIDGASVQSASLMAHSFEEGEAIISGINSPSSSWRGLVACHAGQDAFKYRYTAGGAGSGGNRSGNFQRDYQYRSNDSGRFSNPRSSASIGGGRPLRFDEPREFGNDRGPRRHHFDDYRSGGNNAGTSNSYIRREFNEGGFATRRSFDDYKHQHQQGSFGDNHQRGWTRKNFQDDGEYRRRGRDQGAMDSVTSARQPTSLPPKPNMDVSSVVGAGTSSGAAGEGLMAPKGPASQQQQQSFADAGYPYGSWPADGSYYSQYSLYPHPSYAAYSLYGQYPSQGGSFLGYGMAAGTAGTGDAVGSSTGPIYQSTPQVTSAEVLQEGSAGVESPGIGGGDGEDQGYGKYGSGRGMPYRNGGRFERSGGYARDRRNDYRASEDKIPREPKMGGGSNRFRQQPQQQHLSYDEQQTQLLAQVQQQQQQQQQYGAGSQRFENKRRGGYSPNGGAGARGAGVGGGQYKNGRDEN